jgi:hypothetical protein
MSTVTCPNETCRVAPLTINYGALSHVLQHFPSHLDIVDLHDCRNEDDEIEGHRGRPAQYVPLRISIGAGAAGGAPSRGHGAKAGDGRDPADGQTGEGGIHADHNALFHVIECEHAAAEDVGWEKQDSKSV